MGSFKNLALAMGVATLFVPTQALAVETVEHPGSLASAEEFGPTLPPIGYVRFCAKSPAECKITGRTEDFQLTPARWQTLYQVNTMVNTKVKPVSDQELYGQAEVWTLPKDAGDCEDYLLLKKKYLEGMGFPSSSLLITVVYDERDEGHAVLTVATNEGDFILDNRRNDILRWHVTGYRFLKRQSHGDPKRWVALVKKPPSSTAAISATQSEE
jgi:predicted transglutaminase-like cysteine proteinase